MRWFRGLLQLNALPHCNCNVPTFPRNIRSCQWFPAALTSCWETEKFRQKLFYIHDRSQKLSGIAAARLFLPILYLWPILCSNSNFIILLYGTKHCNRAVQFSVHVCLKQSTVCNCCSTVRVTDSIVWSQFRLTNIVQSSVCNCLQLFICGFILGWCLQLFICESQSRRRWP